MREIGGVRVSSFRLSQLQASHQPTKSLYSSAKFGNTEFSGKRNRWQRRKGAPAS